MANAVLQAHLGQNALGGVQIGRPGADISFNPSKSASDFTLSARPERTTSCPCGGSHSGRSW